MSRLGLDGKVKRLVLIVGGTALGLFFFYLAFRDISWSDLAHGIRQMQPIYFIPGAIGVVLIQLIRAARFGLILSPICRLTLKDLWDILNIWGALNMIMPARSGELVRPYLLQQRGAPFSSGLGAVMVERFFDLWGLLTLLALVLWTTPHIPRIYSTLGMVLLVILSAGYAAVLLALARKDRVQTTVVKLTSWLPGKASFFLGGVTGRLVEGLGIMANARQALIIFACSILIWSLFAGLTYTFLVAFSIKVPFLVAITIQVLITFGVALPSAPGFIGTFHAAGRYSLALFGVAAVPAIAFATVYHVFSFVMCGLLGLISYWSGTFRLDFGVSDLPGHCRRFEVMPCPPER
jgi:uncharacterized protein (TIRG00374 family)